jgi:hypothetical protein
MMAKAADKTHASGVREIRLDQLLGRPVLGANNHTLGRLEEFRVVEQHGAAVVTEYVIGRAGLAERLGVGARLLFGGGGRGYVARWDQVDVTNPEHPRLTCSIKELREE